MDNAHSETELKLFCANLMNVRRRLESMGAQPRGERVLERNLRYEDDSNSLAARDIVLRLRQDARARLTLKMPGDSAPGRDAILRRFEAEVEVSDFDTAALILERLGYQVQLHYEKYRSTWALGTAEIALDELPCGNFVEIEGDEEQIEHAVMALALENAPRLPMSYAAIFDEIQAYLGLPLHELSFAAFANIALPPGFYSDLAASHNSDG
ncbi:MAG: class IV adenylate cyclase [Anaerolineae bacterium]|nr:class IV adenylate cyclase [Anaerolineae bacterium]